MSDYEIFSKAEEAIDFIRNHNDAWGFKITILSDESEDYNDMFVEKLNDILNSKNENSSAYGSAHYSVDKNGDIKLFVNRVNYEEDFEWFAEWKWSEKDRGWIQISYCYDERARTRTCRWHADNKWKESDHVIDTTENVIEFVQYH